ncbi:unnamed protein product [Durusdinium trenchii]|uniref:Uncharacterized protein n=2 Tax=Durusdinium trenchii TaxID=1381693 RepID=A0ABP0HZ86_9DINO
MDSVIRQAHRSLQKTSSGQGFERRADRRGSARSSYSDELMRHPLMSSASCMLSMRKENLKEILVERENRALAKRVLNVKSFCDPNGKDLDDYRRHQRMVQVRQDGEELVARRSQQLGRKHRRARPSLEWRPASLSLTCITSIRSCAHGICPRPITLLRHRVKIQAPRS